MLSGANRTDMKKLADLLDAVVYEVPLVSERHLCLDRGYDYAACRETAAAHGYAAHIPPRRSAAAPLPAPGHPDRHPPRRWVVEAAHSWFNRFRRLLIRWGEAGGELPRLRPTRRHPDRLPQAPPCTYSFGIGC